MKKNNTKEIKQDISIDKLNISDLQKAIIHVVEHYGDVLCLLYKRFRQNQGILIETMQQENDKFVDCISARNLALMVRKHDH